VIALIVELSCDQPDCDLAYAPATTELTDVRATRRGSRVAGWTRRDGLDFCPSHSSDSPAAMVDVVRALAGKRMTDTAIGEALGWSRRQVQKFRDQHGIPSGAGPGRPLGAKTRRELVSS
jgi:hypothetical protein